MVKQLSVRLVASLTVKHGIKCIFGRFLRILWFKPDICFSAKSRRPNNPRFSSNLGYDVSVLQKNVCPLSNGLVV